MNDDADDRTMGDRMTDESRQPGFAGQEGMWQPLPEGEYDSDQTMHVSFAARFAIPPEPGRTDPLAAPGHGYAPPMPSQPHAPSSQGRPDGPVSAGADPAAAEWSIPTVRDDASDDSGDYSVGTYTASWSPPQQQPPPQHPAEQHVEQHVEPAPIPADATGQWTLPVVPETGGEHSGRFPVAEPAAAEAESDPLAGARPDGPATGPDANVNANTDVDPNPYAGPGPEAGPETAAGPAVQADEPLADPPPAPESPHSEHPLASYVLRVNGSDRPVTDAWLGESLLYVLRERLGLAGAKDGCEQGECGACSVQVDGRLVASCLVPAATAAGCDVRTVEGLSVDGRPSDVQRALAECGAVQCGFCVPGLAMTVHDLLEGNHSPTELETRTAISGNLCRCSGYRGVLDAVRQVVAAREAAAAPTETGEQTAPEAAIPHIPHQAGPGGAE
jgi:aerobic-type carbon monoxide dehydrogenase small subunit (CoxS/CutS family)